MQKRKKAKENEREKLFLGEKKEVCSKRV